MTSIYKKMSTAEIKMIGKVDIMRKKVMNARNYAEKNEQYLRTEYGNDYIAVLNNSVLSHGKDIEELWMEVNEGKSIKDFAVVDNIDCILRRKK